MAGEMEFVNTKAIMGATSGFSTILIYLFYVLLIAGTIYGVYYLLSFKHRVRVRRITNGRIFVIDDKARQFKNKNGVPKWRLLKSKIVIGLPPDECLEITKKGKYVAECELTADGSIQWLKYIPQNKTLEAFTSEERTMTIHEFREADSYKRQKLGERLMQLAPILAVLMIITIFLLFAGEVFTPIMQEGANIRAERQKLHENYVEMMNVCSEVCLNRPLLSAQLKGAGNVSAPPN